jgi:hypothetical protein
MQIRYNILSLKEIEFKIDYDQKLVDKDAVTFELFHREKADRQLKTILVEAGAHIVTRQDDFILANDTVRAEFSLDPFDEVIKQDGEGLFRSSVPQLIDTFINVALGALRGIFAKNLVGTYLDGLVLPLIPMKVISDSQNKQSKKAKATK